MARKRTGLVALAAVRENEFLFTVQNRATYYVDYREKIRADLRFEFETEALPATLDYFSAGKIPFKLNTGIPVRMCRLNRSNNGMFVTLTTKLPFKR